MNEQTTKRPEGGGEKAMGKVKKTGGYLEREKGKRPCKGCRETFL